MATAADDRVKQFGADVVPDGAGEGSTAQCPCAAGGALTRRGGLGGRQPVFVAHAVSVRLLDAAGPKPPCRGGAAPVLPPRTAGRELIPAVRVPWVRTDG